MSEQAIKPAKKKTGGRKKGVPNKTTAFTKAFINKILDDYKETGLMDSDFKTLEPKDRLHIMIKLMEFTIPKPQTVQMEISTGTKSAFDEKLQELAGENE
jgi:hypothetical protein